MHEQGDCFPDWPATPSGRRHRRPPSLKRALAPYLDMDRLIHLVGQGETAPATLRQVVRSGAAPAEVQALFQALCALLRPDDGQTQIKSPTDVAAFLMTSLAAYDQEHLVVLCLNTKNQVQKVHTAYIGSINSACVRIAEIFKEPIRLNSAAIIVAHQHPSGDATPSPEDILVTRQIIAAGNLLDIPALDHLVIGAGRFVSMREKGLAFPNS